MLRGSQGTLEATFPLVHSSQIPVIHTLEQADLLSASLVDSIFGSHLNLFRTTFDYLLSPPPQTSLSPCVSSLALRNLVYDLGFW